jgi:neutral trehalase
MVEKYNIETGDAGGGGEYPVQDGFGWTNGVTRALLARYPRSNAQALKQRESRRDWPCRANLK